MDRAKTGTVKSPIGAIEDPGIKLSGWTLSEVGHDRVCVHFDDIRPSAASRPIAVSAVLRRRVLEEILARMDRAPKTDI